MNQNINSELNKELLERLRTEAKNGKTVRELAQLVQDYFGSDEWTTISIIFYFQDAFNLSYQHLKEMSAAFFMNGGSYTDEEIDQLIRPHIQEHYLNKQGEASNERENK